MEKAEGTCLLSFFFSDRAEDELEQLERLLMRYPRHPLITHISDSHQIRSQNKTKSKLQT